MHDLKMPMKHPKLPLRQLEMSLHDLKLSMFHLKLPLRQFQTSLNHRKLPLRQSQSSMKQSQPLSNHRRIPVHFALRAVNGYLFYISYHECKVLYIFGLIPYFRLKAFVKCEGYSYPHPSAISAIGLSVSSNILRANSILYSNKHSYTV